MVIYLFFQSFKKFCYNLLKLGEFVQTRSYRGHIKADKKTKR